MLNRLRSKPSLGEKTRDSSMMDKFDFYDLMSSLVPGVLLVGLVGALFPSVSGQLVPDSTGTFAVIALTALAVFVGQLLVAVGSILEPLLFMTWGGRPSDLALTEGLGDRYMPVGRGMRIKAKLQVQSEPDASTSSLFLKAMTLARASGGGLSERFNALYAYQRTLIVLVIAAMALLAASRTCGLLRGVSACKFWTAAFMLAFVLVICWYRARQRAYYFVREVLMSAEREIDKQALPACDKS